jgi:NADH-quinone oxidoreductase subunit F
LIQFYKHESCGKCTPCREGNDWLMRVLQRLDEGRGNDGDVDMLVDMASQVAGRSFCLLGDAASTPVMSSIKCSAKSSTSVSPTLRARKSSFP